MRFVAKPLVQRIEILGVERRHREAFDGDRVLIERAGDEIARNRDRVGGLCGWKRPRRRMPRCAASNAGLHAEGLKERAVVRVRSARRERQDSALKMDQRFFAVTLQLLAVGDRDASTLVLRLATDTAVEQLPEVKRGWIGRTGCARASPCHEFIGDTKRRRADAQRSKQRAVA
jgi:hypothetical protein